MTKRCISCVGRVRSGVSVTVGSIYAASESSMCRSNGVVHILRTAFDSPEDMLMINLNSRSVQAFSFRSKKSEKRGVHD